MKNSKKSILLVLVTALAICCTFNGYGSNKGVESTNSGARTIVDSVGRTVEIPVTIDRIIPLDNASRMIAYLGLADKCVGMSGGLNTGERSPIHAYAYANKNMWADLPNVGTSAGGVDDYYPEEIIRIDPDVILCTYPKEMADDIQAKTGIPVVAAPVGTLFQKDYEEAFRLLGDVCGVKDRAEEVITYLNNSLDDLANRTASVPDVGKPSVLWAAATFKGAHGIDGVYANSIIFEKIAAKDVTEGIFDTRSGVVVEKEQILGWNPQYIFFDSGNSQLVRTDFEKDPDFFEILTAVQNEDLYQCPNNTYYYSNLEIPIVNCYYIASLLYPEQFADIDFEEKANEIFKFFLGVDDYLSELEAAGVSYGKVTLGGNWW